MRELTMSVSDFKASCLEVIKGVKRTGRRVLITRRGEAVALVCPPPPRRRGSSWLGAMAGTGVIRGDIVGPASDEGDWEAAGA